MDGAIMRLKVSIKGPGPSQTKLVATKSGDTWGYFKAVAANRLGLPSDSNFEVQWEGCTIDEPDDRLLYMIVKDGDVLTLAPEAPQQQLFETSAQRFDDELNRQAPLPMLRSSSSLPENAMTGSGSQRQTSNGTFRPEQDDLTRDTRILDTGYGDKKCTCRNSKCIKLYCICWASATLCKGCACKDCLNTPDQAEFHQAEQAKIRARNPQAFSLKVDQGSDGETGHKVGCRCRKSRCVKKYCECFDAGVRCNSQCRCLDCENTPEDGFDGEDDAEDDLMAGGLDSLASAAQLASGCHEDPAALLTPRMLALVAPYKGWAGQQWQTGSGIVSTSVAATFLRRPPSLMIENGAKPPLCLPPLQNAVKRVLAPDEALVGDGSSSQAIPTEQIWSHAPPTKRLNLQERPPTLPSEKENNEESLLSSTSGGRPCEYSNVVPQNDNRAGTTIDRADHPQTKGLSPSVGSPDEANGRHAATARKSQSAAQPSSYPCDQLHLLPTPKGGPILKHLFRLQKEKQLSKVLFEQQRVAAEAIVNASCPNDVEAMVTAKQDLSECPQISKKSDASSVPLPLPPTPTLDEMAIAVLLKPWDRMNGHAPVISNA